MIESRQLFEFDMVTVHGGSFNMGNEDGKADEKPVHRVTLSPFKMGKYEVTLKEFAAFVNATNYLTDAEKEGYSYIYVKYPEQWEPADGVTWRDDEQGQRRSEGEWNNPVIHVSWNDAIAFCQWLSRQTGKSYRIPTEAEWEYAARGGNQSKGFIYSGSSTIDDIAWYLANSNLKIHPVGQKQPNELGLYDMTGNVEEWCNDWYDADYYQNSPDNNPKGSVSGLHLVIRGGCWYARPTHSRVSYRDGGSQNSCDGTTGFRLVSSL